jgi:hypothetical protein
MKLHTCTTTQVHKQGCYIPKISEDKIKNHVNFVVALMTKSSSLNASQRNKLEKQIYVPFRIIKTWTNGTVIIQKKPHIQETIDSGWIRPYVRAAPAF